MNITKITILMKQNKQIEQCFLFFFNQEKEVATQIKKLLSGTVVFEDISQEVYQGVINKVIPRFTNKKTAEPFPGRLIYNTKDGG